MFGLPLLPSFPLLLVYESVEFWFFFFGWVVCDLGELLKTPVSSPAPGDLVLKALHVFQTCLVPVH